MPMPPTHICQYVPAPGEAVGYKITVRVNMFGTRADMWLRNGERRVEGRERWRNLKSMGEGPCQPTGFVFKNDSHLLYRTMHS